MDRTIRYLWQAYLVELCPTAPYTLYPLPIVP